MDPSICLDISGPYDADFAHRSSIMELVVLLSAYSHLFPISDGSRVLLLVVMFCNHTSFSALWPILV